MLRFFNLIESSEFAPWLVLATSSTKDGAVHCTYGRILSSKDALARTLHVSLPLDTKRNSETCFDIARSIVPWCFFIIHEKSQPLRRLDVCALCEGFGKRAARSSHSQLGSNLGTLANPQENRQFFFACFLQRSLCSMTSIVWGTCSNFEEMVWLMAPRLFRLP